MKSRLKPLVALLAACPWYGFAAEIPMLEEIVVSAARPQYPPLGVSSLGEAALAPLRASTSDAASLLRDIPGVSLYGAGGVSSLPSMHGLADDRLRIKVDGMDLISACANHMNSPLSYIDPANVGSVKVVAGLTPVSVAGDSIGASIAVTSAAPEFARSGTTPLLKGQAGVFYRSNGDAYGGNLSATIAGEKLSMTYNGATAQAGNYKAAKDFKAADVVPAIRAQDKVGHALAGDEVASSHYKSINHALGFALRHEHHLAELKLGLQDIPYQAWPNQRMDMTGNDSTQINLRYAGEYDWGALEARVYNEKTRHKMQFGEDKWYWYPTNNTLPNTATTPGMPMDTEGDNTGARMVADLALSGRDLVRVGGEFQRYRLKDWWEASGTGGMAPDTFWNINNGERDRLGLFAEWEARWNPAWFTLLGARGERVDMNTGTVQGYNATSFYPAEAAAFNASDRAKTDHNLDLTVLARHTPDATRTFEFGYARKTRSPNLYERYAWSTGGMAMRMVNWAGDGNGYVGNLDLKPEVAHTLSAAADWHDDARERWGVKVSPYFTYVDDYIDARRCASANANCNAANQTATSGFVYLQFVNQSARLYGVDISGNYTLADSGPYGRVIATGMVSYTRGENRTSGDNLYNIMPLNAKLTVGNKLGAWSNTLEWLLVQGKEDVSQVRNELKTSGYGLLNLRGSYEWKQVRLDFGVENLLNKYYVHPLGGAYTGQGQTMSGTAVTVPWGVSVPGMGRSLYAGLNVKF
ncbi:MAG: TonB-dependent receptor [Pseudomonadota bacterium]|nr:TonB-dependent receptor [Pseudomonadota bacterium]MDP1904027.1 TonB-dependent receptor [Pseudomonadota bacterium]MDP2352099.1 TonB-dependent receptor [Pseudomonadota bacterium]